MLLPVPVVGEDPGPQWATDINSCLGAIDSHNHTSGQGVPITPAAININTDLLMNGNNLTTARSVRFNPQTGTLSESSDLGCLYEVNADLYYNDGAGNQIRITQSGSVTGSSGTITGLPSGTASASYSGGTFSFQSATNTPAAMSIGNLILGQQVASGYNVTLEASPSQTANYVLVLPAVAPTSNQVLISDGSGNFTWTRGLMPLGGVIATFPALSGAYSTANTTTADANGFVLCGGQTIADATSPMNGAVIPNINNSVFLMGSATSNTSGGSNTTTLTTTQLPAHTHGAGSFVTSLSGTFASSTHTHTMPHAHQWGYVDSSADLYALATYTQNNIATFNTGTSGSTKIINGNNFVANNTPGSEASVQQMSGSRPSAYATSGPTTDGSTIAITGTPSATASLSGSNTVTGTSSSTGTGSSYDSRPLYISAVYLMRIK